MEREISDVNILNKFCEEFCQIVEKHCQYIIVSGFVSIASGRMRGTEDIDMIIEKVDLERFKELYNYLTQGGFVCMQSSNVNEIYDYLKEGVSIRFTWKDKEVPEMEVKFVKDIIDEMQIKTKIKLKLTGLEVWFSNIETNIAFKEELLKSPKDMEDARYLRNIYDINEERVDKMKKMIKEYRL